MYVVYKPTGDEEPQEWVFVPDDFNSFDAEAIETATGWSWDEFLMQLQKGSVRARRALLWVLLRQVHRGLQLKDVRFTPRELKVEYDIEELTAMKQDIIEAPDVPGTPKEPTLNYLDGQIAKARPAPGGEGKAQELPSVGSTPLPSHKSALTQ